MLSEKELLLRDLYQCYFEARKHKRHTHSQMVFESNLSENIVQLRDDLYYGEYTISPSIYFIQQHPIQREVFAGNFRDRIVHHLVFNILSPFWEKEFIYDSYSCRKGKGTSFGIKRISKFMRACSNNYTKEGWILKLDIQGYFMSIDRTILRSKIHSSIKSWEVAPWIGKTNLFSLGPRPHEGKFPEYLLNTIHKIIFNDPTQTGIFKGSKTDYEGLPNSKSLFYAKEGCGLPIGNLTSQLFSNIYLNNFDYFVKKELGIKYYGRYVDDFIIIHNDKEYLLSIIPKIHEYLNNRLKLNLHPKKIYFQPIKHGVEFLGAYIKPYRIYRSKRSISNFSQMLKDCNYTPENIESLNSYLGLFIHYKQYHLVQKFMKKVNLSKLTKISGLIKYYL